MSAPTKTKFGTDIYKLTNYFINQRFEQVECNILSPYSVLYTINKSYIELVV